MDADVLVVGAGPAGAAAATHLRRAGLSVLLLDKRRFPRDKVCGDFVSPAAIAELDKLGVVATPGFAAVNRIRRAALHVDGRFIVERDLPTVPDLCRFGAVIPRQQLDAWVVDAAVAAGADLRVGLRATSYRTTDGGITVTATGSAGETTLTARFVVGADGTTSDIARQLRGPVPRADRAVAVRAYIAGIEGPDDRAELYFGRASFPGYAWIFPTGNGAANVGVGMLLETLPGNRENMRDLLARCLQDDPCMRERVRGGRIVGRVAGWPLATFGRRMPVSADRIVLAGDAATLINSVNGEGIQYALASGRWAAEAIAAAAAAADEWTAADRLAGYARTVTSAMRLEMGLARIWAQTIRNRRLTPACLGLIEAIGTYSGVDAEYAAVAGGYLAGMMPAREVMSARMFRGTARGTATLIGRRVRSRLRTGARGAATDPPASNGHRTSAPRAGATAHVAWASDLARAGVDLVTARAKDGPRTARSALP
ncbi:MAG TPA: geranylgeranyl reductase family protein [Candidatus Dormibacteraeota bacterium]|nr:geranylgeranyl reductase family protein [Candidatus Dormibacteraeota bacterium]